MVSKLTAVLTDREVVKATTAFLKRFATNKKVPKALVERAGVLFETARAV